MQPEAAENVPSNSPNSLTPIFYNDHGLRAGWRLLIYFAMFAIVIGFTALLPKNRSGAESQVSHLSAFAQRALELAVQVVFFLVLLLLAWIMSRIERRKVGAYGLPLQKSALSSFLSGYVLWGFLPLLLLLLVLKTFHAFDFGGFSPLNIQILGWGILWFVFFLFIGLIEEFLLRGYFLFTLADGIGFWPAAIIQAVLFARGHMGNGGETHVGIIATFVFAVFAAVTLWRTGNLWLVVGAHAGWDWGQSFFFGVNDSGFQAPGHLLNPHIGQGPDWLTGGTVGPEGSVITLILWALMALIFVLLYRKRSGPALLITEAPKY